jgi:hypothetical protein
MAELGFEVIGVDVDPAKVELLQSGRVPFYEPGLDEVLARNIEAGRLRFTTSLAEAGAFADVHFICVGTPQQAGSHAADMTQVFGSVAALTPHLKSGDLVVGKSTVPVGSADTIAANLASVEGVPPGSVNLIAPRGTIDAGDAGIRATGDITIAAAQVLNADNITAGGATVGGPSAPASAPSFAGLSSSSSSTAATSSAASEIARQGPAANTAGEQPPSTITVEVLGYGGGEGSQPSGKEEDDRQARSGDEAVPESAHSPG